MKGIIYILIFFCFNLSAQDFEAIDFKNGLSQNTVLSMAQDESGFVWLGTADGLDRFDGISTRIFRNNNQEENSICGNEIMDIVNDKRGNLWIATSNCLNKLDLSDYSFTHYYHDPTDTKTISGNFIYQIELVDGYISLITENGLDIINLETGEISRVNVPESAVIKSASILQNDKLLISTSIGIFTYNIIENNLVEIDKIYNIKYRKDNIHRSLIIKTSLFIAYQDEIIKYDLVTGKTRQLYGIDYIETRDIKKCNDQIWFCTSKGIKTYNCLTHEFKSGLENGLPIGVAVNSFLRSDDEIWFSVGTGVFKYSAGKKLFETIKVDKNQTGLSGFNKVWHLCNEGDTIIISTEHGISFLAANGDIMSMSEVLPMDMNIQYVSNVSRDESNIWICTFDAGIYHVDMRNMKVQNYSNTRSGKYFIKNNTVRHSLILEQKVLFSTDDGLFSFDKASRSMKEVLYHSNENALSKKTTYSFLDNTGRLWIGTQNGLYVKDSQGDFSYYTTKTVPALSNNRVINISQQSDSRFLIGTSSGLNVFDVDDKSIEYIDVNAGLANDVIYSLEIDDDNDVWVSTNKGISLINADQKILNFNINDGLQGSEFNTNASVKSNIGDLYFGGLYGISKFNPREVKELEDVHTPIITKLRILQHEDEKGFELTYPLKQEYELTYSQCNFIVSFVSINFTNPENNIFYYKLDGYNHEWIKVEGDQEVQFMNLPGGTYDFKVRASLRNGELSSNITSLRININPPFYKSLLFRLIMLLALFTVGFLIYRIRIKAVEYRNVKLKEIVDEQTKKLKHSNNLQEIFLKEIPEALVIFNSKNEITITNDLYKKMISSEDQISESLNLGIKRITNENLNKLDSELSIEGKHYQFKFNRIVSNDKDYGIAVLLRDTTNIKNAEQSLRQNEILFRSYFEKSPIGIVYITDPLEPISNCNQKFCDMMGIKKADALTKTMMEFTYSPDLQKDIATFKKAIKNKTAYLYEPNKRLICPGEKIVLTETHVTFIYNDKNEYQYMFALIHDVTEQRESQKNLIEARTQLIQSEKLASLGQITAGVAHEINNPVNFIYNGVNNLKTLVETLKSKHNTEDLKTVYQDIQQMIDAVEDGAKRTAEIVKSLRLFTRVDTINLVSYDIISGIESTITLLSNKIKAGITIERHYKVTELFIRCYPGQLNQVFMNLILNAIEAIDVAGVIQIDLEEGDKAINIIIRDTGSGIDSSISNMIFEPFFSTKGPINGTGLGLSISNTIIEKHKGSITYEKNEPKGTVCIISIPTSIS